MIGRKNLHVTAERANFPLGALYVRAGSAANVALFDVPVRGGVDVTAVTMRVTNVDGVGADFAAERVGATWVVDVPASHLASVGTVVDGVVVWATGTGADGAAHDWNIGVGDLCVLASDAAPPVPGETLCVVRLRDVAPTSPIRGDAYISGATLNLYDGAAWVAIGGVDDTVTRTSANPVKSSGIWGAIWGALTALPTGFTALYDWVAAQLAMKLSRSGGVMTGDLNMNGNDIELAPQTIIGTEDNGSVDIVTPGQSFRFRNGGVFAQYDVMRRSDLSGKADAADLRYRIEEAELTAKLPDGVTVQWNGVVVPSPEITSFDRSSFLLIIRDAGGVIENSPCEWTAAGVVVLSSWDERLAFFDSEDQALSSPPDLIVAHSVADRTVNLITATDETSIDIELPGPVVVDGVYYARDFILDIDNSVNVNDLKLEFTKLGDDIGTMDAYAFVTDAEDSIGETTTVEKNTRVRLYFTETAYTKEDGAYVVPVFHVACVTLGDFVTSTTPATQGGN